MMNKIFVIAALLVVATMAQDHCNAYDNCQACVSSPLCGWCSSPVVYKNGAKGFQCAGFNKNGSNPFVCNGIYSTDTCIRGYTCNKTLYQCELAAPGAGHQKAECENNCSTVGKTFLCDNTTHICKIAPAGQGTDHAKCMASCRPTTAPSSHHPSSHHPSSHHPSSNHPSSHHPSSPKPTAAPTYTCNTSSLKCEVAKPGHGGALTQCQATCKPSNHTPTSLLGLWRGFPISQKSAVVETDLMFYKNNTVGVRNKMVNFQCNVVTIANELKFEDCTNNQPNMKCIYETTLTLPETFQAMIACNYGGGAAPTSFKQAMSDAAQGQKVSVQFLSRCVPDGFCQFHFGPASSLRAQRASALLNLNAKRDEAITDPCTQYGSNCSYCLSHSLCGWCSADVVYHNGQTGTQCAGFSTNPRAKSQFTCSGSFSTEMCLPGWKCNPVNQTCELTTPGSGIPNKEDCESSCHAKPGPPSQLIGKWRGLMISNNYTYGVVQVDLSQDNVTATLAGETLFKGSLKHLAADIFITFTAGPNKGKSISGMYVNQGNELVEFIELAFGGVNEGLPKDYKEGMKSPNTEFVLAKCIDSSCKF